MGCYGRSPKSIELGTCLAWCLRSQRGEALPSPNALYCTTHKTEPRGLAIPSSESWRNRNQNRDNRQRRQPTVPRPINNQQEGGGMNLPWRLFEDRVRTGPFGLAHFPSQPHSPARILVIEGTINGERVNPRLLQFIHESPPRIRGEWQLGVLPDPELPRLTDSEFNAAMKKLRKQAYDPPPPKRKVWNRGLFSRNSTLENSDNKNEEGKQCAICLEPFVPKEQVLVTPCSHMFHSSCLVPWVRSHGQCPVCRLKLVERKEMTRAPNYSNSYSSSTGSIYDDGDEDFADFMALVRAMEEAFMWLQLAR